MSLFRPINSLFDAIDFPVVSTIVAWRILYNISKIRIFHPAKLGPKRYLPSRNREKQEETTRRGLGDAPGTLVSQSASLGMSVSERSVFQHRSTSAKQRAPTIGSEPCSPALFSFRGDASDADAAAVAIDGERTPGARRPRRGSHNRDASSPPRRAAGASGVVGAAGANHGVGLRHGPASRPSASNLLDRGPLRGARVRLRAVGDGGVS